MIHVLLQLFFAFVFIALICITTYKVCLKIIDVCFESGPFRIGIANLFFALIFFTTGILALMDFMKETNSGYSSFFPLFFLCAGICMLLGLLSLKPRWLESAFIPKIINFSVPLMFFTIGTLQLMGFMTATDLPRSSLPSVRFLTSPLSPYFFLTTGLCMFLELLKPGCFRFIYSRIHKIKKDLKK